MCGIAGTLALGSELDESDAAVVAAMSRMIQHRGPDRMRQYADRKCILGNTHLSVIGRSESSALPMPNEDESVWICYNGTVTNFMDLKQRFALERRHRFRSGSDTEVLIHLYEELGIGIVDHLSGMFAFCLYDRKAGKAFIVRDSCGMRPVFYMMKGGRLHFASEIKALLEIPDFERRIDRQAMWDFFSLGYIPGRSTPFEGLRELPGGHLLEIDLFRGTAAQRRYHRIHYAPDDSLSEEGAARSLRALLLDSVRRNLVSDAPVGLTLSGGFDSSTLLVLAKELGLSGNLHTFSLKINEPSFDESRYQRIVVDHARPIHHEISINPQDVVEHLATSVAHLDEPSGNGAVVPFLLLSKEANKYVKVLLSGEGGDEMFNAYETHRAYKVRKLYRRFAPSWARRWMGRLAARLPTSYRKLSFDFLSKRFTEGAELSVPESHFFWRHVLSEEQKKSLLPGGWESRPTVSLFSDLFESLDYADDLNKISLIDLEYYFIDDLMVKNDRMVMAHSIEARFPYMERDVVDFVSRIPPRFRIKGLRGRHIQKLAMKSLMPKAIMRRNNMGLEMPHSIWFLKEFKGLADHYFSRSNLAKSGMLDCSALQALWNQHLCRKKDNGRPLWCALNFLIWFDLFVYNGDYKKHLVRPS